MTDVNPAIRAGIEQSVAAEWPGATLTSLDVLEGGRSGITLSGHVNGTSCPTDDLVFKVAPLTQRAVGRGDLTRQVKALQLAKARHVVVPDVLLTAVEPVHFYAMTRLPGEAVEPVLSASVDPLPAVLVTERALVAAEILAAIHAIDEVPTGADGNPEPAADLSREFERWRATAAAADQDILANSDRLAHLLGCRLPHLKPASAFVHGDFRLGNIMFDGAEPRGVIDWEIWGHTDPGIDLGWFLVFCNPELFPGIGAPVSGMPSAATLVQRYRDAGGHHVPELPFYEAFARFKMAAIMAHNLKRHREGRHIDPFQEKLPPTICQLIESAIDLLS